jgi:DNA segregation ATPase FtsK/SpoIIIE, S-DNA-T family
LAVTNPATSAARTRAAKSVRQTTGGRLALLSTAVLREAGLIAVLGLAAFLLLALISYSPHDPAWSYRGTGLEVTNLVGRSGAWTADLMLSLLGILAYALPVALVLAALRLMRARAWVWPLALVRATGWLATVVAGTVLARIHVGAGFEMPAGAGGMLGDWLVRGGMPLFNWLGLTLIALMGVTLGSQAALGFSWLGVAEATGRLIYRLTGFTTQLIDRYSDRIMARHRHRAETRNLTAHRKAAVQAEQSLKKTRKPPAIQPPPAPPQKSPKAVQKAMFEPAGARELPSFDLMDEVPVDAEAGYSEESLTAISRLLELKLRDFGVEAEVVSVLPGPVITRFEIQPAPGVKVSRISSLVKDLARSLAVISVRIVEVIPGKSVVGIEIPNEHRSVVGLRELITSDVYQRSKSPLTLALGKDIGGEPVVADITRMPHLLVAGTTGSGKSVGVNAMLLSVLYKSTPDDVRLILVDPKMLELAVYEGIPHLLTPVVTDMKEAAQALHWCVGEMERRYRVMAALGVRNLAGYNRKVKDAEAHGEPMKDPLWPRDAEEPAPDLASMPLIMVVIDEFADMMMVVGKKVEQLIARIAQKARAAGIHLVLATQRPSVDVITGLIKANIPSRISFQVSSRVDSRTILDQGGAEQLLGHGDMLYLPPGSPLPTRVHGAFVSDEEVHRIVADWKKRSEPNYLIDVLGGGTEYVDPAFGGDGNGAGSAEQDDALYDEAIAFVIESRRASISAVQRKLRVGYNRAARLIEAMEEAGVVSPMNSNGSREVLVPNRD